MSGREIDNVDKVTSHGEDGHDAGEGEVVWTDGASSLRLSEADDEGRESAEKLSASECSSSLRSMLGNVKGNAVIKSSVV